MISDHPVRVSHRDVQADQSLTVTSCRSVGSQGRARPVGQTEPPAAGGRRGQKEGRAYTQSVLVMSLSI